jgi:heme iron utilization protein
VAYGWKIVKLQQAMSGKSLSPATTARTLLAACPVGALATRRPDGHPFASYVAVGRDADGAPLLLLSRLAMHTRNLAHDPRASLLLVEEGGQHDATLARPRLTLTGRVVRAADAAAARARFIARHPDSAGYADFADFAFYRMEVTDCYLVAGFGQIAQIAPGDVLGKAADGA